MSDRLKTLTDKIYAEGIEKAVEESERILAKAKEEAALIRADAKADSEKLITEAQAEANNHQKKVLAEIKLAARKSVNQLKQELHQLLEEEILSNPIETQLNDPTVVARLLEITAGGLTKDANGSWRLLVNESQSSEIKSIIENQKNKAFEKGIELGTGTDIKAGFVIEQDGGKYKLVFDAATFTAFLGQFLKVETRNLLES